MHSQCIEPWGAILRRTGPSQAGEHGDEEAAVVARGVHEGVVIHDLVSPFERSAAQAIGVVAFADEGTAGRAEVAEPGEGGGGFTAGADGGEGRYEPDAEVAGGFAPECRDVFIDIGRRHTADSSWYTYWPVARTTGSRADPATGPSLRVAGA